MLKQGSSQLMMVLLSAVVMSSLSLLVFGLNPAPGPIEIMQLPTTLAQIVFVFAVVHQVGMRNLFAPMTHIQRGLIGALIIYVFFVSLTSPVPSSSILAPTWIVHIFFFVALVSFFSHAQLNRVDKIWTVLGLTALIHVCVFLIAWALWPQDIRGGHLPAFDNIRHLGYFLAPAAAVMAVQFVTRLENAVVSLVCFAAAVFYILYTGSRGGAVALVAGLMLSGAFMAWHSQRVPLSRVVILIGVTGVAITVAELLPALPWKPVFGRGVDALSETGTEILNGRSHVWKFASLAIEQNWLWGYGPAIMGQIPEYLGAPYRHPHNIGLQLLLHWGAIGTVIVLGVVFSFVLSFWEALRSEPFLALMPVTVITTMFIHALVDGGLFYSFSTVLAIIAFASLVGTGWRWADFVIASRLGADRLCEPSPSKLVRDTK